MLKQASTERWDINPRLNKPERYEDIYIFKLEFETISLVEYRCVYMLDPRYSIVWKRYESDHTRTIDSWASWKFWKQKPFVPQDVLDIIELKFAEEVRKNRELVERKRGR